jgi:multiple sugar transport system substrate-binding protein
VEQASALQPDQQAAPTRSVSRRAFMTLVGSTSSLVLLAACGGGAPAAPPAAPAPAAPAAPAAAPAAPAASPAPGASPSASPAAGGQTAPAAAPAALPNLKGTTLSIVQGVNFVPALDPFTEQQIKEGFMKETGAQVNIEFIDINQVQPKAAAAIQAGSGPDIFQIAHNWAHLYKDALIDVTEIAEDLKKNVTGDYYAMSEAYTKVDGKYLAVPHDYVGATMHWRKSWFKEVGVEKFPATFEELHAVGKKLKDKGHPLGQSLGHSIGDPIFWVYPMIWAYGGQEVDANGKVAINSPGTIAAVAEMKKAWSEAYDETGLAWDDSGNNRAFLAETISCTQNGASIWWVARNDKKTFFDDIALDFIPAGPKGQYAMAATNHHCIMKYSKNVDAAKAYIRWLNSDAVWMPWFEKASSFHSGVGPKQNNNPIWATFPPVAQIFKKSPEIARPLGYPGPANQKVALVQSKYILGDMFAKAIQGDSPESAVAWAEKEMQAAYAS